MICGRGKPSPSVIDLSDSVTLLRAVRRLLDQEAEAELARDQVVEGIGEVWAEQSCVVPIELTESLLLRPLAFVPLTKSTRGDVGIAAEAADHEIPAFVADVDAEGAALATKWAVAQILDARGDQRAAVRPDRLRSSSASGPRPHNTDGPSDSGRPCRCCWRRPLGRSPSFFDINSSRGVSMALAAMTKTLALTQPVRGLRFRGRSRT